MIQIPASFSCRRVLARLVTSIKGTLSAAPLATLLTVAVRLAVRALGIIIARTPAASAVRRQAPRLCGPLQGMPGCMQTVYYFRSRIHVVYDLLFKHFKIDLLIIHINPGHLDLD